MAEPGGALVGRGHELASLRAWLAAAEGGGGRAAVVLGEPGIGKTALVEALAAAAAARGVRVAWGRCSETDTPAFWPWRQALRALGASALADGPSAGSRPELFAQVADELAEVGAPAVVALEDIHWADPASLALLRFVIDTVPGLPLLLVATTRDDPAEVSGEATELLRSLPPGVERVGLSGLDGAGVAEVAAQVLGRPPTADVAERIAERSGGNPFFVREVARLHASRGPEAAPSIPPGVRQVLERHLARLGPACRELLAVAAVAGEPDPGLLAEVVGKPLAAVQQGLSEAVTARLLVAREQHLRFAHALARETVYAQQPPDRVGELHRQVAEALARHSPAAGPDPGPDSGRDAGPDIPAARLAWHWRRAAGEDAPRLAAEWARSAAREAHQRMGYEQATRYYRWALEDGSADRLGLLVDLGEAEVLAGDLTGGRGTLRQAASLAKQQGRFEELARAVLWLGGGVGGFEVSLFGEEQVRLLEDALAGLPADDSPLRAAVMARLSLARTALDEVAARMQLATDAVAMARRVGDPQSLVAALAAYCDAIAGPDFVDERLECATEMLAVAGRAGSPLLELLARRIRLVALLERGDISGVDSEIAAYARVVEPLQLPLYAWPVPVWRGMRALMEGDIAAVRQWMAAAHELGQRAGSTNAQLAVDALRMILTVATGTVEEFIDSADWTEMATIDPYIRVATPALYAAAGRTDEARRQLPGAVAAMRSLPKDSEWLAAMWLLGDGAIAAGDEPTAQLVYDALEPYPHLWRVDSIAAACSGAVSLVLGRLAAFLGRTADAERWLTEARDRHRAAGATLLVTQAEQARTALAGYGSPAGSLSGSPSGGSPPGEAGSGPPTGELRRSGRVWQVRWEGEAATVPDSKGMRDLAVLLAAPEREVHVLDLVEAAGGPSAAAAGGHTGERLDSAARTAYRQRLADLEGELAEAEANADVGRVDALRREREFLAAELAGALGLGGRTRVEGDPVERARKSVTMRIRTALKVIAEVSPALARHLDRSVATGRWCAYRPERPVRWKL